MQEYSRRRGTGPRRARLAGKTKAPIAGGLGCIPGAGLSSHRVAPAVVSALRRFTTVFGTGTGGAIAHWGTRKIARDTIHSWRAIRTAGPGSRPPHWGNAASGPAGGCAGDAARSATPCCCDESERPASHSAGGGRVGCAGCPACTPRLMLRWSAGGLTGSGPGSGHLGAGFALRCVQRFSVPDIATGRCPWRDSPNTSGPSTPVLSY